MAYDDLRWAIDSKAHERNGKVAYLFRRFENTNLPGTGFIKSKDGDEIRFGQGEEKDVEGFSRGRIPALCNLHYTVVRVSRMSGATDMIAQAPLPNFLIDLIPTDFANILTPKLLNSGTFPTTY